MAELAMMTSRQSRLQQAAAKGSRGAAAALILSRESTARTTWQQTSTPRPVQIGAEMHGVAGQS